MSNDKHIDQPFIHAITAYRRKGWLGTIPLPPGQKHPPPKGYTGHLAKYPAIEQIKRWCDPTCEDFVDNSQIGLRLADVDVTGSSFGMNLPAAYGGHIVTGWELIGIDVDTYKDKNGFGQLLKLQQQLGELPPTVRSSSRWDSGTTSYIALYFVPKGYRYVGKAASCIEIIQKRHRYMVVWPSVNPDAGGERYTWRLPDGSAIEVPDLARVPVLPEAWWAFLSNNGMGESDDPISELTGGQLQTWAFNNWRDADGEMCDDLKRATVNWCNKINDSAESHPLLVPAQWHILRMGSEGHAGWLTALKQVNAVWRRSAGQKRDSPIDEEEVRRCLVGALGKIEPTWISLPNDPCECKEAVRNGDYDDRLANWGYQETCGCGNADCPGCDIGTKVAAADNDGMGPVIGRLQIIKDMPVDSYDMNDVGNAEHLIDLYGDNLKFIDVRRNWTVWLPPDGTFGSGRWYADSSDRFASLAYKRVQKRQRQYATNISLTAGDDKAKIQKARAWKTFAKNSGNATSIKNALDRSKCLYVDDENPVAITGKEFDANFGLLGCANGVIELTDDPELRAPKREDYVTYNTNVPYVPWRTLATSDDINLDGYHLWDEYLRLFLPDPKLRHFVQKVMGHLIVGGNPEKYLVFLYGPHDTGKSTMLSAIAGALGDYYAPVDMNMYSHRQFNPQLAQALPRRVLGMSEVDNGGMDAATVKRLTGNDRIVLEMKYSNETFEGIPQFTTVIACNNPPDINNADAALKERILALPFDTTIERAKRKFDRQTQIEMYSGIAVLSWLVEGYRLYREEGIGEDKWPDKVALLRGEIISNLNPTQTFIKQMLIFANDCEEGQRAENEAWIKAHAKKRAKLLPSDWPLKWTPNALHLFQLYQRWCQTNGADAENMINFGRSLGIERAESRRVNGVVVKCYMGVMLRDD